MRLNQLAYPLNRRFTAQEAFYHVAYPELGVGSCPLLFSPFPLPHLLRTQLESQFCASFLYINYKAQCSLGIQTLHSLSKTTTESHDCSQSSCAITPNYSQIVNTTKFYKPIYLHTSHHTSKPISKAQTKFKSKSKNHLQYLQYQVFQVLTSPFHLPIKLNQSQKANDRCSIQRKKKTPSTFIPFFILKIDKIHPNNNIKS